MSVFETIADFVPVWIPTAEKLPETGKSVLITIRFDDDLDGVTVARMYRHYNTNRDEFDGYDFQELNGIEVFGDVTAWMPLPSPYKAKRDNDGE